MMGRLRVYGGGATSLQRQMDVWWESPQPPEARESKRGTPSAQKFCCCFFGKNDLISSAYFTSGII